MVDFDTNGITLDGTNYHVRVVFDSMERAFTLLEGSNSGMSLSGRTIRDIIGTQYAYSMTVEPLSTSAADQAAYDSFYEAITSPVDYHTVKMPYGQTDITFDAQVISGKDKYKGKRNSHEWWREMTVTFIPMEPQRT